MVRLLQSEKLTGSHQLVDFGWAPLWLFHTVTLLQEVIYLGQVDAWVGRHAVGSDLPQQDSEGWEIEE